MQGLIDYHIYLAACPLTASPSSMSAALALDDCHALSCANHWHPLAATTLATCHALQYEVLVSTAMFCVSTVISSIVAARSKN